MPSLFAALPPLIRISNPLFVDRDITLIGVSAILYDDEQYYFEVNRPRYWGQRKSGDISVGIRTLAVPTNASPE